MPFRPSHFAPFRPTWGEKAVPFRPTLGEMVDHFAPRPFRPNGRPFRPTTISPHDHFAPPSPLVRKNTRTSPLTPTPTTHHNLVLVHNNFVPNLISLSLSLSRHPQSHHNYYNSPPPPTTSTPQPHPTTYKMFSTPLHQQYCPRPHQTTSNCD